MFNIQPMHSSIITAIDNLVNLPMDIDNAAFGVGCGLSILHLLVLGFDEHFLFKVFPLEFNKLCL